MGRPSTPNLTGEVRLDEVPIDEGGYDPGWAYWGLGPPLWCAWNDEGEVYTRAPDREAAKAKLPRCIAYR